MSNLPSAVYATASMTTAVRIIINASSGTSFGNYTRPRQLIPFPPAAVYQEFNRTLSGTTVLPTAVYGMASMVTAVRTIVLATSGAAYGQFARVLKTAINLTQAQFFIASAFPKANFTPAGMSGAFTASAYPTAVFTSGFWLATAKPTAQFSPRNDIYTHMDFVGTWHPTASFTPFQPNGFVGTWYPKLTLFLLIGQRLICASGTGSLACPKQGVIARYKKPLAPTQ